MARIVLTYIVPFLLPSVAYLAWGWYRGRYAAAHGGQAPRVERGPWPLLLILGALLTGLSLAATALRGGSDAGAIYTPSHLENGQIVPGRMDEQKQR